MKENESISTFTFKPVPTLRRYRKNILLLFAVLALFILTSFIMNTNAQKKSSFTIFDPMMNTTMNYINEKLDSIMELETREEQNTAFRKLRDTSQLEPIRLSQNTAVFLYKKSATQHLILKRVIWNPDNGLNEDAVCEKLKDVHPNLVRFFASQRTIREVPSKITPGKMVTQTLIWLIFERMDIKINDAYVRGNENIIRAILKDILKGLSFLHNNGMAHLDIKIGNIMGQTDKSGLITYKLIDFGYTQYFKHNVAVIPKKNYGTFPYKAPEVINGNLHGINADIWSLGATVWYLAIGQIPFYTKNGLKSNIRYKKLIADHMRDGSDDISSRIHFHKHTSTELKDFVYQCMQLNPNKRPLADDLLEHPFILTTKQSNAQANMADTDDGGYGTDGSSTTTTDE